jgi:SEC-C motif-containing protein
MRSRYSAFALRDSDYLLDTWHPSVRPPSLQLDPKVRWVELKILARTRGGLLETDGTVEFTARYRIGDAEHLLAEHSRFVRENGRWFYVGVVQG